MREETSGTPREDGADRGIGVDDGQLEGPWPDRDDLGDVTEPSRTKLRRTALQAFAISRLVLRGPLVCGMVAWAVALVHIGWGVLDAGSHGVVGLVAMTAPLATVPFWIPVGRFWGVVARSVIVFHALAIGAAGVLVEAVGGTIISRGGSTGSVLGPFAIRALLVAACMVLLALAASTAAPRRESEVTENEQ